MTAFLTLTVLPGCASKRMARQAQKLEDAGLYELAANNYLRSFNANRRNVEAATGLRRTGQRALDLKAELVNRACFEGDNRETVYRYLEALNYQQRIRNTGIELVMNQNASSCFEEAKPLFLDRSFEEARLLLEEENFALAESIFSEIKRIDPSYNDMSRYMRVTRAEPLYRRGVEELNNGFYRRAWNTLTLLINEHGTYKDAVELRQDALSGGMLTISVADFGNRTRQGNMHHIIRSRINAGITGMENPFIRIVDDRNTEAFLREQEKALETDSGIKIGRLMAARALLTGNLLRLELNEGRVQRTERRAWLKETVETVDNVTREKTVNIVYHKVTYTEYRVENQVSGSFEYQLSSTETGTVLASGLVELKPSDRIHYAAFKGNPENIIPGHWEFPDRDSPRDVIQTEPAMIRSLQNLFRARTTVRTMESLQNELLDGIADEVIRALNHYNPEQ